MPQVILTEYSLLATAGVYYLPSSGPGDEEEEMEVESDGKALALTPEERAKREQWRR